MEWDMEGNEEVQPCYGMPENTNPFVVLADVCIDDGSLVSRFFMYFKEDDEIRKNTSCATYAPTKVQSSPLSQQQAEALVRMAYETGAEAVLGSFAVKENLKHIIPEDLKKLVRVAKYWNAEGRCFQGDTYYLAE